MGDPIYRYQFTFFPYPHNAIRSYAYEQSGFKSDFVTPTPYTMYEARSSSHFLDAANAPSLHSFLSSGGIPSWSQPAANAAYEDFRDKALGDQSQVGVLFAEWKQSLGMVTKRGIQLATAANHLLRRRYVQGLNTLTGARHTGRGRFRSNAGTLADTWLEWSFGWKPAYKDIHDALAQMTGDRLPSGSYSGSVGSSHTDTITEPGGVTRVYHSSITHRTGATVLLSNPNEFLMSQIGLANPAVIAWELVPFSFVADWAFDVQSFLSSFTDFVGTSVTNPWSNHIGHFGDSITSPGLNITAIAVASKRGDTLIRPTPNLEIRANLGNSIHRAANAVSLYTQALVRIGRGG